MSGSANVPDTKGRHSAHIADGQSAVGVSFLLRGKSELLSQRELKPLTGRDQYRGQKRALELHFARMQPKDKRRNSAVNSGLRRPCLRWSLHPIVVCRRPFMFVRHESHSANVTMVKAIRSHKKSERRYWGRDEKRQPSEKQYMLDAGLGRSGVTPAPWLIHPPVPRSSRLILLRE